MIKYQSVKQLVGVTFALMMGLSSSAIAARDPQLKDNASELNRLAAGEGLSSKNRSIYSTREIDEVLSEFYPGASQASSNSSNLHGNHFKNNTTEQIRVMSAIDSAGETLCFPAETPVSVIDDSEKGYRAQTIATIQIGDRVVSCNLSLGDGICEFAQVTNIFKNIAPRLVRLTVANRVIEATENHPFYVTDTNEWVKAQDLSPGIHFRHISGDLIELEHKEIVEGDFPVFNLEIEGHHNYFAYDLLVHNCNLETAEGPTGSTKYQQCVSGDGVNAENFRAQALEHYKESAYNLVDELESRNFVSDFLSDQSVNASSDPTEASELKKEISRVKQEHWQRTIASMRSDLEAALEKNPDSASLVCEQSGRDVSYKINTNKHLETSFDTLNYAENFAENFSLYPSVNASSELRQVEVPDQDAQRFMYQQEGLSQGPLVDLGPEFRGHQLLSPESISNDPEPANDSGSGMRDFLTGAADVVCFPGETLILATNPDFTKVWEAEIQSIHIGDYVVSCDLEKAGICEAGRIQGVLERTVDRLVRLRVGNQVIRSTDNHPFYRVETKDWVRADQLNQGDHLQLVSGSPLLVEERTEEEGETQVYNIDVERNHNYYAEGVLVHNCKLPLSGTGVGALVQGAACAAGGLMDCGPLLVDSVKAGIDCSESGISEMFSCAVSAAQENVQELERCENRLTDAVVGKVTTAVRRHIPSPLDIGQNSYLKDDDKNSKKGEASSEKPLVISTPQGPAIQSEGSPSRLLRVHVKKNRPVYRQGNFRDDLPEDKKQKIPEGQYWSGENPASSKDFNERHGTTSTSPPDWMVKGRVKRGVPFVTRPTPKSDVNPGGAIEAVVDPGNVKLEWFHMPDKK